MRRVIIELVVLGIAIGLTVEVIRSAIPYLPLVWLVVLVHFTWEGLTSESVLGFARRAKNRFSGRRLMYSYLLVALFGGGLLTLYWWGLNSFFAPRIARYEAEHRQQEKTKSTNSADTSGRASDSAVAIAGPPPPASEFDDRPANWRLEKKPSDLELHDLFLIDFKAVQQKAYGAIFVDDDKKISVQYAINVELSARSKFLSFYIGRQDQHTAEICEYLAKHYQWVLDNAPQLLVDQKSPGDSGTLSTKEAIFSKRIYIYHETYLPSEITVKLTRIYKKRGLSPIFRSTDYLSSKKMEANVLKLRKEQGTQ